MAEDRIKANEKLNTDNETQNRLNRFKVPQSSSRMAQLLNLIKIKLVFVSFFLLLTI